ncbi:MAG: hypothetical protein ACI8V8_000912, partial [Chitinophagales bacterium]
FYACAGRPEWDHEVIPKRLPLHFLVVQCNDGLVCLAWDFMLVQVARNGITK